LERARECFLIGAQLGFVSSMKTLGRLLDESDPQRWFWWGRAAVLGHPNSFLYHFSNPVPEFNSGVGNGSVVFQIGKALNGHINVEKRAIFNNGYKFAGYKFENRIGPANFAVLFYAQCVVCCRAVDAWSICAARIGVVKDIRVLIGKLVWKTRDLALFWAPKPSSRCVCF
jgi:hypothetical protein